LVTSKELTGTDKFINDLEQHLHKKGIKLPVVTMTSGELLEEKKLPDIRVRTRSVR
jgi:hypothetical protein